jgi:hypothetical protein
VVDAVDVWSANNSVVVTLEVSNVVARFDTVDDDEGIDEGSVEVEGV